jgi:restriction endonuclease Mrr
LAFAAERRDRYIPTRTDVEAVWLETLGRVSRKFFEAIVWDVLHELGHGHEPQ